MPAGRPSSYTDEIANELCERLATTEGGLEEVCKADDMPSYGAVYRWLNDPERGDFRKNYADARTRLGDHMAFRAVSEALTATDHQIGRLKMDARKWAAGRLNGKNWGDKVSHEVGGVDGKPIETIATTMTAKEAADRYREELG